MLCKQDIRLHSAFYIALPVVADKEEICIFKLAAILKSSSYLTDVVVDAVKLRSKQANEHTVCAHTMVDVSFVNEHNLRRILSDNVAGAFHEKIVDIRVDTESLTPREFR